MQEVGATAGTGRLLDGRGRGRLWVATGIIGDGGGGVVAVLALKQ
jgi:hypothetical protein